MVAARLYSEQFANVDAASLHMEQLGIEDPLERLLVLKRRMDAIKGTPEAAVAFGILGIMGLTPIQIEKLILDFFAAKSTGVMTNVRDRARCSIMPEPPCGR
jgi:hypothetical protein